jgi:hypothetical protein
MAAEGDDTAAGTKRAREDAEEEPDHTLKEARVEDADVEGEEEAADEEAELDDPDGAAEGEDAGEDAAEEEAPVAEEAAAEEPEDTSVDQLAEALELLAPVVTRRLDQLHASGLVSVGPHKLKSYTPVLIGRLVSALGRRHHDPVLQIHRGVSSRSAIVRRPALTRRN